MMLLAHHKAIILIESSDLDLIDELNFALLYKQAIVIHDHYFIRH